jgi:hypothetical protein
MDCLSSRRDPEPRVERQSAGSPFLVEFFMVQGAGFKCMAHCGCDGKWRTAFENKELPGAIRILD